jgi:hypothetical protein
MAVFEQSLQVFLLLLTGQRQAKIVKTEIFLK